MISWLGSIAAAAGQVTTGGATGSTMLGYTPFLDPSPIVPFWWLVMLVLVVLVSLAYKTIKLPNLSNLPRQTVYMSLQILAFMVLAALAIALMTELA